MGFGCKHPWRLVNTQQILVIWYLEHQLRRHQHKKKIGGNGFNISKTYPSCDHEKSKSFFELFSNSIPLFPFNICFILNDMGTAIFSVLGPLRGLTLAR